LTQKLLPFMKNSKRGSILLVSSGVGRNLPVLSGWGAYCISKWALEGFNVLLSQELAEFKINVNSVNPGPTRTDMRSAAFPNEDPLTLPTSEAVTPLFVYLVRGDIDVTGKSLNARDYIGKDPTSIQLSL
jgi:NAD(P)-dependent dehydrogenase (short-subunit alcohol dehydrogenase family)